MKFAFAKPMLAVAFAVISAAALAADQDVETLLSHMRDAYKSVKAATYKTTVTSYEATASATETYELDVAYKAPNLMRFVINSDSIPGGHATVISDGDNVSVSAGQNTQDLGKYTADSVEKNVPSNLESICFWDWDRQLSTASGKNMEHSTFKIDKDLIWEGKHWIVLEETAKKDDVVCKYYIDPKTFLIWRTRVNTLSNGKDVMDAKLTTLDTKANLSDAMFKST
jgi:outer membrane lipoprotein-sorting protein